MTLEKSRTIRPSSRQASSSYRIKLSKRKIDEDVHITITHESDPTYRKEFHFSSQQIQDKKDIYFDWDGTNIIWKGLNL